MQKKVKVLFFVLLGLTVLTAFSYLTFRERAQRGRATGGPIEARVIDQKLYVNRQRVAVKMANPLTNWATQDNRNIIAILKQKGYNAIKLNFYWDMFDGNGDGNIDDPQSITNVNNFIRSAREQDVLIAVSFETYNVGGGGVPEPLFIQHPEVFAKNSRGENAVDTEYGTQKKIPSILNPYYLQVSRNFIKNLLRSIDIRQILWYETTVEPQYIGDQMLDYSDNFRNAYLGQGHSWPPAEDDPTWNQFRAIVLAQWIDGDAAAIREVAGSNALIAVDYLETHGREMRNRNGDTHVFLQNLHSPNIIQVNWHYLTFPPYGGFDYGYDTVRSYAQQRNWAISEHMTLNGDFSTLCQSGSGPAAVLEHTIQKENTIGWDIVNTLPHTTDAFAVYNSDWSPKCAVAAIDTPEVTEEWFRRLLGPDYRLPTTPTYTPIPTNTPRPSPTPAVGPTNTPIRLPSPTPTANPTNTPIVFPSIGATIIPSPTPAGCLLKNEGDADCDGSVNLTDYEIWRGEYLGEDSSRHSDFDDDGRVTLTDFEVWRGTYLQ